MPNIFTLQLAENLQTYRDQHRLSQEQLGELLGKHRTYVGKLESGAQNVSLDYVVMIAGKLDVHPEDVLDGDRVRADRRAWAADRSKVTAIGARPVPPPLAPSAAQRVASNILAWQLIENVRAFRVQRGLSQERLAREIGRSRSYMGGIESGQNLTLVKVVALAADLGLHPTELFEGERIRADRAAWEAGRASRSGGLRAASDGRDPGPPPKRTGAEDDDG